MTQQHRNLGSKWLRFVWWPLILIISLTSCGLLERTTTQVPLPEPSSTDTPSLLSTTPTPTPDVLYLLDTATPTSIASPPPTTAQYAELELVGQVGGRVSTVFVLGEYAYVGVGPRLMIFDISNSTLPTLIGKTPPLHFLLEDILVSGSYAYVAAGDHGLQVFDVSSPSTPELVRSLTNLEGAWSLSQSGEFLYLTTVGYVTGEFVILDITSPAYPTVISRYSSSGVVWKAFIEPPHAYVTGSEGLLILDISDPTRPSLIDSSRISARDLYVTGSYAFLAAEFSGLSVFDVSDLTDLREVAFYSVTHGEGFFATTVHVEDDYAYVSGHPGLTVFDVYNPLSIYPLVFHDMEIWAVDAHIEGSYAYLASGSHGLKVIDISRPDRVEEVGSYRLPGNIAELEVTGDFAYLVDAASDDLRIIDISDPSQPQEIGYYDDSTVDNVDISEPYAYIVTVGGIGILDISDPAHPEEIAFHFAGLADDVFVQDSFAYITSFDDQLAVLDVEDPANPIDLGGIERGSFEDHSLTVSGSFAYLTTGKDLQVVDVSDPSQLKIMDELTLYGSCYCSGFYDVLLIGSHAYVANGDGGVRIVNVSDPSRMEEVGVYETQGHARGLDSMDSLLFVADEDLGLIVLDVSLPTHPQQVASFATPGKTKAVEVMKDDIYLADGAGGLFVIRISFEGE